MGFLGRICQISWTRLLPLSGTPDREDGLNRAAGRRHLLINQTEHHSPRPPGFHDVAAPASLSINNDQFPESTEWIHQDSQHQKTTSQPPASLLIATAVTTAERHDGSKL